MAPAKGLPSAFSSPPPLFFIAIPQSIKPLLSAPPLPAKVCVLFKIQHFGFQSSPWEFPGSFILCRPLLILLSVFYLLTEIYLFTSIGTYCSQPLGPSPPLALQANLAEGSLSKNRFFLLCLAGPTEGNSEFSA